MANTQVQKGVLTLPRFPGISRQSQDPRGRGVAWRSCHLRRQMRSFQMPRPASSSLPPHPPSTPEGNASHPALGQAAQSKKPPTSHSYIQQAREIGAGAQLVKYCSYPPSPTNRRPQIGSDLDSGKDGRKVLEKQDPKVPIPGPRKEGSSWASRSQLLPGTGAKVLDSSLAFQRAAAM